MTIREWPRALINRRDMLGAGSLAAGIAGLSACAPASQNKISKSALSATTVTEVTNISVAPSPDGKWLAFDLLGLLWIMPASGGDARCISDAYADLAYPCWSPDGSRIAFQSYRSGNFHIWSVNADGKDLQQHTSGLFDHREPIYTPDGKALLFSSDRTGRYAIHKLEFRTGIISQLTHGESQDSEPCIAPDGKTIAYVADALRLMLLDKAGETTSIASVKKPANWTRPAGLFAPTFSPDGQLSYVTIVDDEAKLHVGSKVTVAKEDIYPFRTGWLGEGGFYYASNGKIRVRSASGKTRVVEMTASVPVSRPSYLRKNNKPTDDSPVPVRGITSPTLSPNGKQIAFGALNDLYLLTIGTPQPKKITTGTYAKQHPAWSPDGKSLVYSSDRAGTMDLWLHDLETGNERQLTELDDEAAVFPCWHPDGSKIAFLNHAGALHLLDLGTNEITQLFNALWLPGRPSFSPDGSKIALAAFKPYSRRFREGLSEILVIDVTTGEGIYTPIAKDKSIATRGDDGPIWSPDGNYFAYVFASTLWIQPIDKHGAFNGAARKISSEVTDAPSWSGDSNTLLYLSNGKLRLAEIDSDNIYTAPLNLTWSAAKAPDIMVIRNAHIWDALGSDYREGDVVIRNNRIAGIEPAGSISSNVSHNIDANGQVLMPGLIDMHTHRQVHGSGYGDRIGRALLSMGITATRSPGGAAYYMTEDKESINAGRRIAPRHFGTGEALDGNRIYYNFMRPVTEPGQLDLELSRATALGYDMVKTYVRMDNQTQEKVINAAHAMGLPVSSHYHYPALRFGADGVEHMGATNRFGFSRTTTRLGAGYDDVNKVFAAARGGRTPTLFSANALLPEYQDLVSDVRIRTLLPPWDLARFDALAEMIKNEDREPLLASLENKIEQIKSMMANGWRVHTGTDAPIDTIGVSYHLNLRAMTRYGISAYETLLTATRNAGEYLNEPIGTIAPGQIADLILVDGDPLTDIADLINVKTVICGGIAHDVSTIAAPFATTENQN
ncbi:amidohydrolase family protein [Hyphococcus sp. DH-69]|uniref:amidohydrolase family protein n=1 Tax=Hyphococcus formosus TaxID=3143534 RepID=UPI00398B85B7